jgi:hypothetical protein
MSDERAYYDPHFNGTDNYWKHPFGLIYTDSVKDFAEEKHAYWTIDVVASYLPNLKGYDFLVLYFDVDDSRCSFYAREDTDEPDVVRQEIEYTDLSVSIKLYLIDGVLMFPSDN